MGPQSTQVAAARCCVVLCLHGDGTLGAAVDAGSIGALVAALRMHVGVALVAEKGCRALANIVNDDALKQAVVDGRRRGRYDFCDASAR